MLVLLPLTERRPKRPAPESRYPPFLEIWLFIGVFITVGLSVYLLHEPEGIGDIGPKVRERLLRKLKEIDEAEQYVLFASDHG